MSATRTFAIALESLENETKRAFLELIENPAIDPKDIDTFTFSRIVRLAHLYGMAAGDFCSEFGVTLGTVSRWRTDVAHPGEYMRGKVFEFIRLRVRNLNLAAT
jgi:hypothetical protein